MYLDVDGAIGFAQNPAMFSVEMAADRTRDTAMYARECAVVRSVKTRLLLYGCTAKPTRSILT